MTLEMNATTMKRSLRTLRSFTFPLPTVLALLIMLLAAVPGVAQQETYNWLFDHNAWIQFPGPISHTGSALYTSEGSSSISDSSGHLLFYTDGVTVWDKNSNIMPGGTGLNGNESSTDSALIVPCGCGKYFIFTTDAAENHYVKGLQYSVVNAAGSGSVGPKNVALLQPAAEKITAVSDGSGGFWVVAHGMNDNRFYSWHVTPDTNCVLARDQAVISRVGTVYSGGIVSFGQGQIKISPDRSKLAVAGFEINGSSFLELFSFNPATGVVGNLSNTTIRDSTSTDIFYGVEFSPDSQYLYASATRGPNKLYQYSTAAASVASNAAFTSHKILVHDFHIQNAYEVGALQLGPDGNIYIARVLKPFLSALNTPGANALYIDHAVQLANGTSSYIGLPAMVAGTFPCETPPPVDTCCPPWNSDMLKKTMFYQGSGGIGDPYMLKFQPTTVLNAQMLVYLNLLHTMNSGITSITITFNLYNLSPFSLMEGPKTATWTWPSGVPSPSFFSTQMNVNHWYRVDTVISLNGNNHLYNEKCIHNWMDVDIQVQGNARVMRTRSADGSVSERRINSNSEREIQQ